MLCTVVEFKVKLKLSLPRKIEPNYRNHRSFFFSRVAKYLNNRNRQSSRSNVCMCGRRKIIGRCNINSIRDFVQQIFIKYEFHFCNVNVERLDEKIDEIGWIVSFSFFLSSVYRKKLNFCVRRVIRDATSIFIFCQTHVSIFSPSIAPPILQDPLGWRISNDQHGVIHHVRTTNFVIVDPFAVNQNRSC